MKNEQEIKEKLIILKSELDTINNLKEEHLQEYNDKLNQIKLIEWILNIPIINKSIFDKKYDFNPKDISFFKAIILSNMGYPVEDKNRQTNLTLKEELNNSYKEQFEDYVNECEILENIISDNAFTKKELIKWQYGLAYFIKIFFDLTLDEYKIEYDGIIECENWDDLTDAEEDKLYKQEYREYQYILNKNINDMIHKEFNDAKEMVVYFRSIILSYANKDWCQNFLYFHTNYEQEYIDLLMKELNINNKIDNKIIIEESVDRLNALLKIIKSKNIFISLEWYDESIYVKEFRNFYNKCVNIIFESDLKQRTILSVEQQEYTNLFIKNFNKECEILKNNNIIIHVSNIDCCEEKGKEIIQEDKSNFVIFESEIYNYGLEEVETLKL